MIVSLNQQIEEVQREIALRERVYPHQIASGKMRQGVADYHMDRMRAVLATLRWLSDHEAVIKRACKTKSGEAA